MSEAPPTRYQVFLSHNSIDKPVLEELARRLEGAGISTFLDKWHLIPGDPWQPALEKALDQSAACAVFIGPSGLGPWQNEEMRAAIARRVSDRTRFFRVVPVLLPGARREPQSKLPTFLVSATWVEFPQGTVDDGEAFHRLKCGIEGKFPGMSPGAALYEGQCPYRGLQVFDVDNARLFFGRDAQVDWMVDGLARDFGTLQENRFLGVVGASGSGKSSLVRAGLVPALQTGRSRSGKGISGSPEWPVVMLRPGTEPLKALADALWLSATTKAAIPDALTLADQLLYDERRLHATIGTALAGTSDDRRCVIVVDQFEELFTQFEARLAEYRDDSDRRKSVEAERQAFVDNLLYAATIRGGRTLVILTLRADFYGKCSNFSRLAMALADAQELVPPLSEDDLRAAIEQPALLCGLELDAGLVDLLLQDMRRQPAGALPLLQQSLYMLYERRNGRRLTVQAYRDIGEIEGALEAHANSVYSETLRTQEQRDICRRVLLMLTTPGEGTEDTRRRVSRSQLGDSEAVNAVLQELVKARLITISHSHLPQVEVTHEALIRGWKQLRQWLDADRDSLRTLQQLIDAAEEWVRHDRDPAYVLTGSRLLQAEEWRAIHGAELKDLQVTTEFLDAAVMERNTAKSRRIRLYSTIAFVGSVLFLISIGSSAFLWVTNHQLQGQTRLAQRNEQNAQRELSTVEYILGVAARDRDQDSIEAGHRFLRAAQVAMSASDKELSQSMLIAATPACRSVRTTLTHNGPVIGAAFNRDETRILTWSDDNTARLWDLTQDEPLRTFPHQDSVNGAAFNRDETRILTWSGDKTARLWDLTRDEPFRTFPHQDSVNGAAFNRDETRILTWSGDKTARLWDLTRDEPFHTFPHQDSVNGAAFSRDETRILTWSNDKTARLWDVTQDEPLRTFPHQDSVIGAAFNRDETRILTWSNDSTARLWDLTQDEPLRTFPHQHSVIGAAFNRDETRILTWSGDKTARLWDVTRDKPLRTFPHQHSVYGAAFNRDETRILTWSNDNTARLWDLTRDEPLRTFPHQSWVNGAAFNRDETRILTWSDDSTARLWDLTQDEPLRTFPHQGWVNGAAFNRDGTRILTWSSGNRARLWNLAVDNSSIHRQIVDFEFRSGTRIDSSGQLRLLTPDEREQRRPQLQTAAEAPSPKHPSSR